MIGKRQSPANRKIRGRACEKLLGGQLCSARAKKGNWGGFKERGMSGIRQLLVKQLEYPALPKIKTSDNLQNSMALRCTTPFLKLGGKVLRALRKGTKNSHKGNPTKLGWGLKNENSSNCHTRKGALDNRTAKRPSEGEPLNGIRNQR